MGYESQIALKTTTEGWVLMRKMNNSIEREEERPLTHLNVERTETGFYKISHDSIKWYEHFTNVKNFNKVLDQMNEQNIPFIFIRIGEDINDIDVRNNWTDEMPDELARFEPQTEIYDESAGSYATIMEDGEDKIYEDLFIPPKSHKSESSDDSDDLDFTKTKFSEE